jgi:hypothetical protein
MWASAVSLSEIGFLLSKQFTEMILLFVSPYTVLDKLTVLSDSGNGYTVVGAIVC